MPGLEVLLEVQEHDTAIDRLRHRRVTLTERAELQQVEEELAALERSRADVSARREAVAHRQKRFEDECALVEAKVSEIQGQLYSGAVTVPRELQAMQAEVDALQRRASALEDNILEAMTEAEPLDAEIARLREERTRLDAQGARLRAAIAEAEAAIDAELAGEVAARQAVAGGLPTDLAERYERLRARLGGVGAARLVNGRCGGCHLTLPATELDRIRREPPDAVVTCDQCGRLLVH